MNSESVARPEVEESVRYPHTPKRAGVPARWRRVCRAALLFVAVFIAVVLARESGPATGYWLLGLAGVLVLLIPSSAILSQRILINMLVALGLVPLSWWIPEQLFGTDHGTMLLAGTFAGLSAWIALGPFPLARVRRLVPVARWVDALPFLAGALSAVSLTVFLSIRTAEDALSIMVTRWDYQSHFSIYYMLRSHGSVIPMVPAPAAGGNWAFSEYPQGFHAVLATLAEIVRPTASTLDAELVSFINLQAVVSILTVVLVIAGLCSLPAVRQRAAVLTPVIAAASASWVLGPGAIPVYEGFANFYLACGLAAGTVLALLSFGRRVPMAGVAAVAAGVVGVCHNWLLLTSLIAVVVSMTLGQLIRDRHLHTKGWWAACFCFVALGCAGIGLSVLQVAPLLDQTQGILAASGGIAKPDFGWAVAIVGAVVALGAANVASPSPNRTAARIRRQAGMAGLGLLLPVGVCIVLAYGQIQLSGTISYYFYKYLIAVELFAWVLVVATAAPLLPPRAAQRWRPFPRASAAIAIGLLALTTTQIFGFSLTGLKPIGLPPTAFPIVELVSQSERLTQTPASVRYLLDSGRLGQAHESIYLPADNGLDPILASRWELGLSGAATSKNMELTGLLAELSRDYGKAPEVAAGILRTNPGLSVIVDPEIYGAVQSHLAGTPLTARVISAGRS